MRTSTDIRDELYTLLKASPLATEITGGIYTRERPSGSRKEDIIPKVIALSVGGQLTEATAYINIYTQDIDVPQPDGTTRAEENTKRIRTLATIGANFFRSIAQDGYIIKLTEMTVEAIETSEHVISMRINYKHCDNF